MDGKKIGISVLLLLLWCVISSATFAQNVAWNAPDEADTLENPFDQTERIINAGNQIFQQLCAVCHGKSGEGDGVTASSLEPKPANLQDDAIQDQSDGALYWKIKEGRPPMPPFGSQLSDKQMWAVVTYIKSLN